MVLNMCMGNDKFWIVVPSGEGGRGTGLGRDSQCLYFQTILKDNEMLKFDELGGGYHRCLLYSF